VATLPFVRELLRVRPGARLQLTSTTRSGRERLRAAGHDAVLAPLDTPQAVRRFHRGVQPERLFLLETELWPHWLLEARRSSVPVAVVSARLSERSVVRYRRLGGDLRALVAGLAAVLCQSEDDLERWTLLGAKSERACVVGNLKSDGLPEAAPDRGEARRALGMDAKRPLLVLGNVRPGEARPLARAWRALPAARRAEWQVVAVPRHPRALSQLQSEALGAGLASLSGATPSDAWRWDERLGVLTRWYQAADVAFVGGSLAPYGGHNPMEPAACGAAVIMGVHDFSQRASVRALERAGAMWRVADGAGLARAFETLLGSAEARSERSRAGLRVAAAERGSAARAVTQLAERGLWPSA
jgi:3-deoxy-D-manno-octulosonic-acid transferase